MVSLQLKPRRTFVVLTSCTLAIFAALLFGLTAALRVRLQREIRQREARAIHDVAVMQISSTEARLKRLNLELTSDDVFAAMLESRLNDVLAVQLFDVSGVLRDALPAVGTDSAPTVWWSKALDHPVARYFPRGDLGPIFGLSAESTNEAETTPLLEVVVPLHDTRGDRSFGIAHYWIDAREIAAEFRRLDQSLVVESGVAFLGGAALIGALLAWSYRRLTDTHRQLLEKTSDLERANQELDFAAKTGALGAISAHLIHGIRNPLAGLEGFVNETAAADDPSTLGEARQTAMETARRLRAMVNEVVTVLRDETTGATDYVVAVDETLSAVKARASAVAASRRVRLAIGPAPKAALPARTANLASLVLANLLSNAIEASPSGTTVQLDTRVENGRIHFLVTDVGPGLPPRVREALFRPVVSTKPSGGGMGLAISSRLARHAGGELSLLRSDATGSVFCLNVPAANELGST